VTGAFVTHHCWDEWRGYFEDRGYTNHAPAWPFKDATAAELRARQPHDTDLAHLTLAELVDHYADIAKVSLKNRSSSAIRWEGLLRRYW
jgi:hypothetical protein